jgi:uridine phosphorylase
MCATQGLRAGCVAGVIANRNEAEMPDEEIAALTEEVTVRIVVEAARRLIPTPATVHPSDER